MPEGTLRFGVVVGHRHIRLVLATMSTLVVGVKVVHALVIVLVGSSNTVSHMNHFLLQFISTELKALGNLVFAAAILVIVFAVAGLRRRTSIAFAAADMLDLKSGIRLFDHRKK